MEASIPFEMGVYVRNSGRPFGEGLLKRSNQFHLETGKCMIAKVLLQIDSSIEENQFDCGSVA